MAKKKILLFLLPFWTPLIPPMGLACLKSFLQQRGYRVKVVDANVDVEFRQVYDKYFAVLEEHIPREMQGNFYNIGIDVLANHMTAYFNRKEAGAGNIYANEEEYRGLIKMLIDRNFFCAAVDSMVVRLDRFIGEFYTYLEKYLLDWLEREEPEVLGVSVYKGSIAASLFACKRTRETHPHIMTVMGGGIFADQLAVGSPNLKYFLENTPYIDKIFIGEGEELFFRLLEGELPESQRVFMQRDFNPRGLDLSSVGLPDFSDFEIAHYPQLAAYTSRSCPFQCGFCAETVNWGKYRKKSAAQVKQELNRLYQKHGAQLYLMTDSLLNPIITDLSRELVKSDKALYWDGYLRIDRHACDENNIHLWRQGGFYRARLGIESGSHRVLKLMNKGITPDQIRTAVSNLARAGIKTTTYWVIGYPGETEEDFLATLDMIEDLQDDIYEAECNPFRFYLTGQVQSGQWTQKYNSAGLYPGEAQQLLTLQTWVLEEPQTPREEIYRRLNQFVAHCLLLGIPNPYSWSDIYAADKRWKKLHPNSVPPLVTFQDEGVYIDECKKVEKLVRSPNILPVDGDFDL